MTEKAARSGAAIAAAAVVWMKARRVI